LGLKTLSCTFNFKTMSRFLLKIIKYFIFVSSINITFLFILAIFDHDMFKRIESVKFNSKRFSTLFFGNSLALDGIDAKYLNDSGISTYNFALSGASIESNLIQLKEYVENNEKPDLVVLCLSTCIGEYHRSQRIEEIHPIVKYTRDIDFEDYNFPLSIFRWKIIELAKVFISKNHRNAKVVHGQYKSQKIVYDTSTLKYNNNFNLELLKQSKSLNKFSMFCQKQKIKLIFIDMLGFKSTRYAIDLNAIKYNLFGNDLYQLNTTEIGNRFDSKHDWIGNSHLNKFGAEKFTIIMNDKILRSYFKRK
jgi:hypothetical protein